MSNSRCTPSLERSVFTAKAVRGAFLEGFLVFLLSLIHISEPTRPY